MQNSPASTDFFERQGKARRSTRFLVLWFALAVAGTALIIYSFFGFFIANEKNGNGSTLSDFILSGWNPIVFLCVFAGTLIVLGGASLIKSSELSGASGREIARSLGGREIGRNGGLRERRLVNIVQEMSLASGVPVPSIFILENEDGINAFAAGTRINNAAIAVSAGALDKLSRDELQAVVGHEFSHILNGDMRLNIRLVGWIFGLTMFTAVGYAIFYNARIIASGRSREEKGAGMLIVLLGIALLIGGAVGSFFGRIIQAGISRSRERLADASSAQFTRNPLALANALSRIGGDEIGSKISSPRAGEFAHLFFAKSIASVFSTHPPLAERIRALDPHWNGKFLPPLRRKNFAEDSETSTENPAPSRNFSARNFVGESAFSAAPFVGVPAFVAELAQNSFDAKALVYLLLMTDSPAHNVVQAKILRERESAELFKHMENLWTKIAGISREKRISAVLLAAPALRDLSPRERENFCETLNEIAETDGEISLYEFCILNAVRGILIADGREYFSGAQLAAEAESVLNLFLIENAETPTKRQRILAAALARQNTFPQTLAVLPESALTVPALEKAFSRLRRAKVSARKTLLDIAADIAAFDGKISADENDLLRAFAVALDCPPPQIS